MYNPDRNRWYSYVFLAFAVIAAMYAVAHYAFGWTLPAP
jgi:hypothetical protein